MKHPAPYTPGLIPIFAELLGGVENILDPFAGTGRIHQLRPYGYKTVGVEIEPEWADMHDGTIVGDSTKLTKLFKPDTFFDGIVTSPCYGNRFADSHNARDKSHRRSYTHDLGHALSTNNAGSMQWGKKYRDLHIAVWKECFQMLHVGGLFILNIKDHIRNQRRVYVAGWHVTALARLGFVLEHHVALPAKGMRVGENGESRVPDEQVYVFRKSLLLDQVKPAKPDAETLVRVY